MRLAKRLFAVAFVLVCVGAIRAQEANLRVFYTGHSFHMFVPARVANMAKAADIKGYITVGTQGLGGSRVEQHWKLPDEKNQAKKILQSGAADVFTMAPNVAMPDAGIDLFAELGLKHNPKLRLLVQESWVPFDYLEARIKNNAERDHADLKNLRASQEKWRSQMEAQAKAINDKAGRQAVCIVPAGAAVVTFRELVAAGKVPGIAKQSDLFTDAIGHVKKPLVVLASYCNFICITGRNPVGLKLNEPELSDELHALIQRIAWDTVSRYPMSGVKAQK